MLLLQHRTIFVTFVYLFSCVWCVRSYEVEHRSLYVAEDPEKAPRGFVINRFEADPLHSRSKRDASTSPPAALEKNISTWTTHLNDSHQQLMVHWVGEGFNVIICLARDASPKGKEVVPSSLYISYDYGKNFTNKTEHFKLGDSPDSGYAQLDKFFNHPKYPEYCVFVDSANKKIYYTKDNGKNIHRSDLSFSPSELAFDEEYPEKYVVLDKVDSNRTLYVTVDGGKTFKMIQSYVKTFFWSSGQDVPTTFYVERWKPGPAKTSSVQVVKDPLDMMHAVKLIEDVNDFQIKGDFMFATKQSKEKNSLDLYIRHQNGRFYKAEFQTELNLAKFHIADVTDKRIFVSVMHRDTLTNLYVSEINNNFTQYNFVLSLEQVLSYFPNGNWKDSWLEDVTEDPFTDLYRVEGLKGIYIASKVDWRAAVSNIGPEHLISLITFDHGVTWSPINPPTEDENGKPLNCHIENSCSLHMCQKFSQLYPVTSPPGKVVNNKNIRSASIMSSKSAPGIIMATGVMGKSLKGIPGVYISRDAGLTWKRILKDYHFFNYGDHGGVLVAVKYFKTRGETNKILYSTNEGIEWNSYNFNAQDLRIYGLMTEPGENTTTFTMFGSAVEEHQWIIITIDLLNTFPRNCTKEDYKMWSPAPPNSSISCVLGSRDVFYRRLAHTKCYNGLSYDRPKVKQVCSCSRRDYECDFGFMLSGRDCIRNQSMKYDPYAVPADCRPGQYYKRTKGYRKIDGDYCEQSGHLPYAPAKIPCPMDEPQEFLIVALRDKIARIDLSNNSTIVPVRDQKNIVAIEFDIANNCIYWGDIELDKIKRQCFNGSTGVEVIVDTDLSSIEGMALDWISHVLFFVDGMRKKIEAVRTDMKGQGRMRATILDSTVLSKPRGIAVHPEAGYLFWTDWDRNNPSVSRSNLDGTEVKKLFGKPIVQWPNGITIDQMTEKIYWVDAMEDYIACSDMNGGNFRRILWNDEKVSHPFAVAVLKDKMYWDDWKERSIFIADKTTGGDVITINSTFNGLMDLKVFAHFVQHGSNACVNSTCETLCLGAPGGGSSCLCPDGFVRSRGACLCSNGMQPSPNMTCPRHPGDGCDANQFMCKNGLCIADAWRCNSNDDCGDNSDEANCHCAPPMLGCDASRCYLPQWRCDGEFDCGDQSDEKDCFYMNCTSSQFTCANKQCVQKIWVCDGDNDCKDGSDERNCTSRTRKPVPNPGPATNCSGDGFRCAPGRCIPASWVCDGEADCAGGEDELPTRCKDASCPPYMHQCPNRKCIYNTWVCDGENDCGDAEASDEQNCTSNIHSKVLPTPPIEFSNTTCQGWNFKCGTGMCIPYWWRCDSIDDCGDNSDEIGCGYPKYQTTSTTISPDHDLAKVKCQKNQFTCSTGVCIPLSWVCDMTEDCSDGLDEASCGPGHPAHNGQSGHPGQTGQTCLGLLCGDRCVPKHKLCNRHNDCEHGEDEWGCEPRNACTLDAVPCDGKRDCFDGRDEENCTHTNNGFDQELTLGVDQTSINSTSFLISCWMAQQQLVQYSFLPSINKIGENKWKNMTWINDSIYRFNNLEPYTNYNVTLFIKDSKTNKVFATYKYVNTTTGEGVPSPPRRISVRQLAGSRVAVSWDGPAAPRGVITHYTLTYTPPVPPLQKLLSPADTVNVEISGFFKPNVNYSFWVTASNKAYTSESSEVATITFDEVGDVDEIVNVSMSKPAAGSVRLTWHNVKGADGYLVRTRLPYNYGPREPVRTKENTVTLTELPPGINIYVDISAYKGSYVGNPITIPIPVEGVKDEKLNVTVFLIKGKRAVQLNWSPPTADRYKGKQLMYEVHYRKVPALFVSPNNPSEFRLLTSNTSALIEDLAACQSYVFTVGLKGGPLSRIVEIFTRGDPNEPIKNLRFEYNEDKTVMMIMWDAICDILQDPVVYRVDVTELTRNRQSHYELVPSRNATLVHLLHNIPAGARYNVCIHAVPGGAAPVCGATQGAPLAAPKGVVAFQAPTGHMIVTWQPGTKAKGTHEKYEVLISEKEIPENTIHITEDVQSLIAETSPILVNSAVKKSPLYVAVRRLGPDGYVSDLSEVLTLHMDAPPEPMSARSYWWTAGAIILGIVIIVSATLVVRRRRLRPSLAAHTPRYDRRRGQAIITQHDDDDVPPIQGFSDDEPLVIA